MLTPKPVDGDPNALKPKKINVTFKSAVDLLGPYSYKNYGSNKSCRTSSLVLILFQVLVLRQPIDAAASLAVGLAAVIVGLAVFMEGLSTGLMPFGKIIEIICRKKPQ